MAEPKTKKTKASVKGFLAKVADPVKRRDAQAVCAMMERITGEQPAMWGPTIVGFGAHDWVTADGRATPWPIAAFSPRSTALVIYIMPTFPARVGLLAKLGKHSIGKSCLYIKRLDDVHLPTLEALVTKSMQARKSKKD
jgi:hypothetical protein